MGEQTFYLILTFVALGVAGLALAYKIYRDYAVKAEVKFEAHLEKGTGKTPSKIFLSVHNLGPKEMIVESLWTHNISIFKMLALKGEGEPLMPEGAKGEKSLPKPVPPRQMIQFTIPFNQDCFLKLRHNNLGMVDSFDREHWIPKKQLSALQREYDQAFTG